MLTATLSEAVGVIVALLVAGFILFLLVRLWRWLVSVDLWQLRRDVLAVLFAVAAIATIIAQKDRIGDTGTTGVSPVVTELTNTLHFASIDVHTNGTATLTVAWPLELIPTNTTIDILAATSLVYSAWAWQCGHTVAEGETNWIETVSATGNLRFYKAVLRESLTDMDDPDGDGLPNAYELAHHRNPWLADSGTVPRLTVGEGGQFATLQSALAASDPYSVVAVTAGVYRVSAGIEVPHHPVMVTCEDGYAVFSGATPTGMFILADGHESGHTLFRNLYLNLASTSGMQAGFWCGGSLPWQGPGAAAVFENVHIRAPNPGVEYFGWLFFGHCAATAEIRGCNVNAAGSKWIYGVFGDNPPPIALESCTFVNFPTQGVYQSTAIGMRSTHANGAIPATPPVTMSCVLFDASFTNAWPMARFENAEDFLVTMADCIRPSEPAAFDFTPNVTDNVHVVTSQVAWAGFPLPGSPEDVLGIGAFAPLPDNPDADMDDDGLSDYDEAYGHGTDPFLADSDNDGVPDAIELLEDDTDPTDPHSFLQRLTVTATNTASHAFPIRVAWGYSATGWETNGLSAFSFGFGETIYTNASSHGATHVKAFCDLNGNGEYDADNDILLVRDIPYGGMAQIKFTFGDVDGDGVPDALEREEQTDPYDANNFRLVTTVNFVPCGVTSWLTNYVAWGYVASGWESNDLASFNGTNLLFDIDVPVTNGELYVKVFRDLNTNGVYDAEADALKVWKLTGTGRGKTVTVNFGDEDNNELPDWWETLEGLDAEGVARLAYDDPDGDGLINLHEYWCDTHPLVPDGSNTLLSVASRAIDDRIQGIDPATAIPRFVNYFVNGTNGIFQLNTNFWARDLDLSCVNVWHNGTNPGTKAATLITRKHVVLANHWYNGNKGYTFCDTNGQVCVRSLLRSYPISDDLRLGCLNEALPESFKPAQIPATNIVHYLATGKYLPTLCLNQEKGASVAELIAIDTETTSDRGIHYQHYGCTSQTNLVSAQRCNVRGATVDGNSGCPVFVVVGDELVLLFSKHLGQKGGETWRRYWGPVLPFRLEAIQRKIDEWEGDDASMYQVVPFDFSSFGEIVNQR